MLFKRALIPSILGIRTFSTATASKMATPVQSFKLDRSVFNQTLYSSIRSLWFQDLPPHASVAEMATMKRWFGIGSEAEKLAFDADCRRVGGAALESISPSKLALPAFESYEKDIESCNELASPFLAEVQEAEKGEGGAQQGAETLLSLILLLDQFSRNLNRDLAGLKLVYTHYDRLSFALLQASLRLSPSPAEYEGFRYRPVLKSWYFMPLLHSEHLPSHELFTSKLKACLADQESKGDEAAINYVNMSLKAEESHMVPMRQFGRFPHRNECLERNTTEAEKEHLKDGKSNFGVKQGQKAEQKKDEL